MKDRQPQTQRMHEEIKLICEGSSGWCGSNIFLFSPSASEQAFWDSVSLHVLCAPGLKASPPPGTFAVLLDSDVRRCTAEPQKPSPDMGTLWHLALIAEVQAPCNAGSTSTSPSHPHPLTHHTRDQEPPQPPGATMAGSPLLSWSCNYEGKSQSCTG